ncbi:Small-subunit processome Utp12 [Penicillium chermesinum]|nr:Small-subunit processome Utp12 [Penicillium chermesinum]
MGKKTSRPATKVGSAASPGAGLSHGSKSSILRAAFSPSEYQLALFASVIQGLDAQHLRIHDTTTGRLQCEHALAPKEVVTSLDWGYCGGKNSPKKKRKRGSEVNGNADGFDQGDVVVAFGTSTSDIRFYSPVEDAVVSTLTGAHEKGIKDFKFTAGHPGQEGWSIGGDNKLIQWDLRTGKSLRTIHLPSSSIFSTLSRPVPSNPPVICASQAPFLIDIENSEEPTQFSAMRNQIHTVITSSEESATGAFLAADGERFINVFDASSQKLVRNLVAETDVTSLSLQAASPEKQILAAVTSDGTIEFFSKPFAQPQTAQSSSAKASRKQMTQKASAALKVVNSSDTTVSVVSTTFHGHEIIVAYAEGGVIPVFERVKFLDENTDELAFTGTKVVAKTKSSSIIASAKTSGTKDATESRVDETFTHVQTGNDIDDDVEMNDTRDDVSDSEDADSEDDDNDKPTEKKPKAIKAAQDSDIEMDSAAGSDEEQDEKADDDDEEEDGVEPSFDDDVNLGTLVPGKPAAAVQQIPTGVSLSTVLTQSLKTNDSAMLESCFYTTDINTIRTTIQRLDSSLAATLLQKIAERLSSRPGRYGRLLAWMQWVCVAHGGALAGHPELLKRISTLYQVMDQRSSSLSSLLLLKGKLDMLEAQLGLRRALQSGAKGEDEDEDDVIYVEGQEDEDSDEAESKPRKSIREQTFDEDESMMNGIADESEDDVDDGSEDEEEDDDEGLLDVEAEESAGSSDAEESLEENEDDDDDEADSDGSMVDFIADTEDEESDDAVAQPPPAKKSKSGKKKGGKK